MGHTGSEAEIVLSDRRSLCTEGHYKGYLFAYFDFWRDTFLLISKQTDTQLIEL